MMNQNNLKLLRPMILIFMLSTIFFVAAAGWLTKKGIDQNVLIIGNILLFFVSLVTFLLTYSSLRSTNPHVFVRAMYGSFIIKFFVLSAVAFVYIIVTQKNVNKPALFFCMGLYIVYTFFEVISLLRMLKQKKNV